MASGMLVCRHVNEPQQASVCAPLRLQLGLFGRLSLWFEMLRPQPPCATCEQAYQGHADEGGTFRMSYSLEGDPSQLPDMVAAIELEPSVHLVASGCGIPGEPGSRSGDDDWS